MAVAVQTVTVTMVLCAAVIQVIAIGHLAIHRSTVVLYCNGNRTFGNLAFRYLSILANMSSFHDANIFVCLSRIGLNTTIVFLLCI